MLICSTFPTRQRQLMLFATRRLSQIYLLSFTNVIQVTYLILQFLAMFNLIGHTFRACEKLDFRHGKKNECQSRNVSVGMHSIYLQISCI